MYIVRYSRPSVLQIIVYCEIIHAIYLILLYYMRYAGAHIILHLNIEEPIHRACIILYGIAHHRIDRFLSYCDM